MPSSDISTGIFAGLVAAIDWYDNSLQSILASRGFTVVNRGQAMMLAHIVSGTTRPSDIAREMRTTRQHIHAMAKGLIDDNIVHLVPDPDDGRSREYTFSEGGDVQREKVQEILHYLNGKLADRIGKETVRDLRRALASDWGDLIVDAPAGIAR
jgi:DNA-binding MarR family transcriptional regulator